MTFLEDVGELHRLVWGDGEIDIQVFRRWCQGFHFSPTEPTALIQSEGGPCAILASIQAVILRDLLFNRKLSFTQLLHAPEDHVELLISAILDIMRMIEKETHHWYWIHWSLATDTSGVPRLEPADFLDGLNLIKVDTIEELHGIILSLALELKSPYSVLCFLYSVLLTHGLNVIHHELVDETEVLIDPVHGHASQFMINLLISGQGTSYLFDGERNVSGIKLKGLSSQPHIGFLTLFEAMHYCESGWYLKNPSFPIWLLGSETHLTVLASSERSLVSDNQSSKSSNWSRLHKAQVEFARLSTDPDGKSGFIACDKLSELLNCLEISIDERTLNDTIARLDPEELGVILEEAFLRNFFPKEMDDCRSTVQTFSLLHYNGLKKAHANEEVRYRFGEARLLDPTDELVAETDPLDHQSPIHRSLRTKWPTIRVAWDNNHHQIPSLN